MKEFKVFITSENPVKINAVKQAFKAVFRQYKFSYEFRKYPFTKTDQPMSRLEGYEEAEARIEKAIADGRKADYFVSLEGANEVDKFGMMTFGVVVIKSCGKIGRSTTPMYYIPPKVAELVKKGYELGTADDMVFGTSNSKQSGGASGLLTKDLVPRERLFTFGTIFALIPFINPDLY